MKFETFDSCFIYSENARGFFSIWAEYFPSEFALLMGEQTPDDVLSLDRVMSSQIGFLQSSPVLETLFDNPAVPLLEKQAGAVRVFVRLRFDALLKVKGALETDLTVSNGYVRNEERQSETDSLNKVSAFNAETLQDDNSNKYNTEGETVTKEKRTDTKTTVANIRLLADFYKSGVFEKVVEYVKDLFTLQVA